MEHSLSGEAQLVTKLPIFYGYGKFLTVFVVALHRNLFWATWILFTSSDLISLSFVLILFCHVYVELPSVISPSDFPSTIYYVFLNSPMSATFPTHFFSSIVPLWYFGEGDKLWNSSFQYIKVIIFLDCYKGILFSAWETTLSKKWFLTVTSMLRISAVSTMLPKNEYSWYKRDTSVKLLPSRCENSCVSAFVTGV
jgi:hypothetical protein